MKACPAFCVAGKWVNNGIQTFISPIKWKGKQWITFGAIVGTGALLYSHDEKIQKYVSQHQDATVNKAIKYGIEPIGSGVYSSVLLGSLYAGARLSNNCRLSSTSLIAAESFVISSLFAQAVKHTIHRHRPCQDIEPQHNRFEGPFKGFKYTSFPSGHATAAFSIASVFAFEYRETIWVPVLAYGLATSVALSRVYNNRHWASDVFFGASLGIYTGYMIHKLEIIDSKKIHITPQLVNNYSGLTLYYSF